MCKTLKSASGIICQENEGRRVTLKKISNLMMGILVGLRLAGQDDGRKAGQSKWGCDTNLQTLKNQSKKLHKFKALAFYNKNEFQ